MKTRTILLLILLLIGIDQGIKLIIYTFFIDTRFEIVPNVLGFLPTFNSKYSFVNDSLYKHTGMDAGLPFHLALFTLIWYTQFVAYKFFKSIAPHNKTLDLSIVFLTSSVICASLGMLAWQKGVLDFLHFKLLFNFVFDLKDIYVHCFLILLLISTLKIEQKHHITLADLSKHLKKLIKQRKCW